MRQLGEIADSGIILSVTQRFVLVLCVLWRASWDLLFSIGRSPNSSSSFSLNSFELDPLLTFFIIGGGGGGVAQTVLHYLVPPSPPPNKKEKPVSLKEDETPAPIIMKVKVS